MIIIYEQDYDITNILDIIEDDKFSEYVEYFKNELLKQDTIISIVEEKETPDNTYNIKVKYDYRGLPEDWRSFNYVKFDKMNNFKKLKNSL